MITFLNNNVNGKLPQKAEKVFPHPDRARILAELIEKNLESF